MEQTERTAQASTETRTRQQLSEAYWKRKRAQLAGKMSETAIVTRIAADEEMLNHIVVRVIERAQKSPDRRVVVCRVRDKADGFDRVEQERFAAYAEQARERGYQLSEPTVDPQTGAVSAIATLLEQSNNITSMLSSESAPKKATQKKSLKERAVATALATTFAAGVGVPNIAEASPGGAQATEQKASPEKVRADAAVLRAIIFSPVSTDASVAKHEKAVVDYMLEIEHGTPDLMLKVKGGTIRFLAMGLAGPNPKLEYQTSIDGKNSPWIHIPDAGPDAIKHWNHIAAIGSVPEAAKEPIMPPKPPKPEEAKGPKKPPEPKAPEKAPEPEPLILATGLFDDEIISGEARTAPLIADATKGIRVFSNRFERVLDVGANETSKAVKRKLFGEENPTGLPVPPREGLPDYDPNLSPKENRESKAQEKAIEAAVEQGEVNEARLRQFDEKMPYPLTEQGINYHPRMEYGDGTTPPAPLPTQELLPYDDLLKLYEKAEAGDGESQERFAQHDELVTPDVQAVFIIEKPLGAKTPVMRVEISAASLTPEESARALLGSTWKRVVEVGAQAQRVDTQQATAYIQQEAQHLAHLVLLRDFMRENGLSTHRDLGANGVPTYSSPLPYRAYYDAVLIAMHETAKEIAVYGHVLREDPRYGTYDASSIDWARVGGSVTVGRRVVAGTPGTARQHREYTEDFGRQAYNVMDPKAAQEGPGYKHEYTQGANRNRVYHGTDTAGEREFKRDQEKQHARNQLADALENLNTTTIPAQDRYAALQHAIKQEQEINPITFRPGTDGAVEYSLNKGVTFKPLKMEQMETFGELFDLLAHPSITAKSTAMEKQEAEFVFTRDLDTLLRALGWQ